MYGAIIGWVLTAYLLSSAVLTPFLGPAGDQLGKHRPGRRCRRPFTPRNVDGTVARRMAGREEIAASIPASIGPGFVVIHHLFSDEIDLDSATSAHGVFAMEDLIARPASTDDNGQARFTEIHGYGHYRPRFTKTDGRWHIAELVLTRLRLDFAY